VQNFQVADKRLSVGFKNPWKIVAEFNSDPVTSGAGHREKSEKSNWRCLLDKVRTYFEENPG
jgi:hypothetical protein